MKYKYLTQEERYYISALKKAGDNQKSIANKLCVNESTISRELKRNSSNQRKNDIVKYTNKIANDKRMYASRKSNLKMDIKLKNIIKQYITGDWSPEQISDRLKAY